MNKPRPAEVNALRDENTRLKAEVSKLKAKPPDKKQKKGWHVSGLLRKTAVVVLLSTAVALLTSGNLLFWFGNTVVKQDRFVAATQPIIKDPIVQDTMALYVSNNIFSNIDVEKRIEQVLPPQGDFLAPQLAKQVKTYTQSTLDKVLANPSFQNRWNEALAKQHQRLISFASKYQGDADISLNDIFNQLTARLSDTKLAFLANKQLPPKVGDFVVISAPWLPAFHNIVVNIDTWRSVALILMVIFLALAVWLSQRRRRTIYIFSLASAFMMLATLIALHITKNAIISKADSQYSNGVSQLLQIVFHSFVIQTITILVASLFIWLIAWITSDSGRAVAVRGQAELVFSGRLHDTIFKQESSFSLWVQRNKRLLQWLSLAVIALIMLLVRLTLASLFIYTGLLLLIVLVIEVVGGKRTI